MKNSLFILLAFAAVAVGCQEQKSTKRTREYNAMILEPTSRKLTSSFSATIQGKQDIDIRPKVQGYITDVHNAITINITSQGLCARAQCEQQGNEKKGNLFHRI